MCYFEGLGRIIPSEAALELLNTRFSNNCMLPKLQDITWRSAPPGHLELMLPLIVSSVLACFWLGTARDHFNAPRLVLALKALAPAYNSLADIHIIGSLIHDPLITDAVSTLLLKCNPGKLRRFYVRTALSNEAFIHATQLPNLEVFFIKTGLGNETELGVPLPTSTFPSLESLEIDATDTTRPPLLRTIADIQSKTFRRLKLEFPVQEWGTFFPAMLVAIQHSGSYQTLTKFSITPDGRFNVDTAFIRPLLFLTQLTDLDIEIHCGRQCPFKLSDQDIEELVKALPKLESLCLGSNPCSRPANNTIRTLVSIATHCKHLFELVIHTNVEAVIDGVSQHGGRGGSHTSGDPLSTFVECPIRSIIFGPCFIPDEGRGAIVFAITLLRLFPRLSELGVYPPTLESYPLWETVEELITTCGRIGASITDVGKCAVSFF
jgi:hypothetical protein